MCVGSHSQRSASTWDLFFPEGCCLRVWALGVSPHPAGPFFLVCLHMAGQNSWKLKAGHPYPFAISHHLAPSCPLFQEAFLAFPLAP